MTKTNSQSAFESIAKQHGHSFHARVVRTLRELHWTVVVSPYYSDNFTDKPREIDIIAEKIFTYNDPMRGIYGNVEVRLFVECKYVAQPTVIWFDDKDRAKAIDRIRKDGFPDLGPRQDGFAHHYLPAKPVAKLFASHGSRDDDPFARAINQNLNALIYYRHRPLVGLQSKEDTRGRLCFPMVVVNGFSNFHQTSFAEGERTTPINDAFQLEVNYAYTDKDRNPRGEYFLIDVVSVDQLESFLNELKEKDVNSLAFSKRHKR